MKSETISGRASLSLPPIRQNTEPSTKGCRLNPKRLTGQHVKNNSLSMYNQPFISGSSKQLQVRFKKGGRKLKSRKGRNSQVLMNNSKRFILQSGGNMYKVLSSILTRRGWTEVSNPENYNVQIKWATHLRDIDFSKINQGQIINHFENGYELSRKIWINWHLKKNSTFFFPLQYDLSNPQDQSDFLIMYKLLFAESVIKRYIYTKGKKPCLEKVYIALEICNRRILIADKRRKQVVSDEEWEILEKPSQKALSKTQQQLVDVRKFKFSHTAILDSCTQIMHKLMEIYPQTYMNGQQNTWIFKPAGKSRGRGIFLEQKFSKITRRIQKERQWYIVQKYIENAMIIKSKKFDIRLWTVATRFNPLSAYVFDKFYIRFGVENYSLNNVNNLYAHLTNNSIVKHNTSFQDSEIEGCMWPGESLIQHIEQNYGADTWQTQVWPGILTLVRSTLKSVDKIIKNRANTFQVYGFDIMLDEQCTPWLLEVNSSPSMDSSTDVTTHLCSEFIESLTKLMLDENTTTNWTRLN